MFAEIIVPIAAAAIGALAGYLGKARQVAGELEKARLELQRSDAEREEKHFEQRRAAYQGFLDIASKMYFTSWGRDRPQGTVIDSDELDGLYGELQVSANAVALVGTEEVREAVEALISHHGTPETTTSGSKFRSRAKEDEYRAAVVLAMRHDVGPPGVASRLGSSEVPRPDAAPGA
jgi:hypothetical protein